MASRKTTIEKTEKTTNGNGKAHAPASAPVARAPRSKMSTAQGKVLYLLQKAGSDGLTEFPGRQPTRSLKALSELGFAKSKKNAWFVTAKGAKQQVQPA